MFRHVLFFTLVLKAEIWTCSCNSFSKDGHTIVTPNDPDNQNSYTQAIDSSQIATTTTNAPPQSGMSSTTPSSPLPGSGGSIGVPSTGSKPGNSNPTPGSTAGPNANDTPERTPANNGSTSSGAGSSPNGISEGSISGNNGTSPNGTQAEDIPRTRTPGNNSSSSLGRGNTSPGRRPPGNNNSSMGVGPNGMGPPGRTGFTGFRNAPELRLNVADRKKNSKYKNTLGYVKDAERYEISKNLYEVNSGDNSKIPKHADCFGFGIPRAGQSTTSTTPSTPTTSDYTQIDQRLRARRRTQTQRRNA